MIPTYHTTSASIVLLTPVILLAKTAQSSRHSPSAGDRIRELETKDATQVEEGVNFLDLDLEHRREVTDTLEK